MSGAKAATGSDLGPAFIDVDEWRETPRPHRYVHGGFEGTHTRFAFYFPPKPLYRGRVYQDLEGGAGGHEHRLQMTRRAFAVAFEDLGGCLVESNQGHFPNEGMGFANDWELFGASAHCALHAKGAADKGAALSDKHRLWWVENAPHGAPQVLGPALTPVKDPGVRSSRPVDYDGVAAQALGDLTAWAEAGIAPSPTRPTG